MANTLIFKSYADYELWTEQFTGSADYQEIPAAIVNDWSVNADLFTACKSWKTALRRFARAFGNLNPEMPVWLETMNESCAAGIFSDVMRPGAIACGKLLKPW